MGPHTVGNKTKVCNNGVCIQYQHRGMVYPNATFTQQSALLWSVSDAVREWCVRVCVFTPETVSCATRLPNLWFRVYRVYAHREKIELFSILSGRCGSCAGSLWCCDVTGIFSTVQSP